MVVPARYEASRATHIDGDAVTVVACVDSGEVKFVNEKAESVPLPIRAPRATTTATVRNFGPGRGWLIDELSAITESLPC